MLPHRDSVCDPGRHAALHECCTSREGRSCVELHRSLESPEPRTAGEGMQRLGALLTFTVEH